MMLFVLVFSRYCSFFYQPVMMASKLAIVDEALEAEVGGSFEEAPPISSFVGEAMEVGGRGGVAEALFGRMAFKILLDEVVILFGEDVDVDCFVAIRLVVAGSTIISGVVATSMSWSTAAELEEVVVEVVVMAVALSWLSIGSTTRCISSM